MVHYVAKRTTAGSPGRPAHAAPGRNIARARENTMEENKLPLGQPEAEDAEPDLITLTDEEGTEYTFEVIDAVDHNGTHYMAMVPYVEDEKQLDDDLQLVIMKVGQDEEGEFLDVVEDDEELYEISGVFEKRLSEEYDIRQ